MKKKKTNIILLTVIVLSILFVSGCTSSNSAENTTTEGITTPLASEATTVKESYTIEEVSIHNSKEDCWLVIHGKVYDVTNWIPTHPGGEAILQGCGKDATELFETRPMGSGTPHSQNARNISENYYIGELK